MARQKAELPDADDLGLPKTPTTSEAPAGTETPPDNQGTESAPDSAPPRRRGRPAGSSSGSKSDGPKKTAGRQKQDVDDFAKQLQGIHMMMAMATGIGELAIDGQESAMLAKGICAVADEYGLALNGKTGAAIQLFGAAAMVYLPRAYAINVKVKKAKAEQEKANANIVDVNGTPIYDPQHPTHN